MPEVYIRDAVRTPVGKLGGSLASTRPDDLAATVVRRSPNATRASSPTRSTSATPTRRARTTATSRAWRSCSPGCRRRSRARRSTGCAARGWRRRSAPAARSPPGTRRVHRRRRRVDEPRAVGGAEAGQAVRADAPDDALDHARLAHGQPARCPTSGRCRWARAPRSSPTATGSPASGRTSSRCTATGKAAAAWERGAFADELVAAGRSSIATRTSGRTRASRSWRSSSRCSARTARSRPATRRR